VCNCSYLLVMTLHSELQWCVFLYFKYLQLCVWLIDSIVRLVQCSSSSRFLSLFLLRLRNCTRELHRFLTLVLFVIARICADNLPVSVALFAGMHYLSSNLSYCFLIHSGLHEITQYECLQTASLFFLSNCFIVLIFLMMAYD